MGYDSEFGTNSGVISSTEFTKGEKQPNNFKDIWAGGLFYLNLIAVIVVGVTYGLPAFSDGLSSEDGSDASEPSVNVTAYTGVIYAAVISGVCALFLSGVMLMIMIRIAETLIKTSLIISIIFAVLYVVAAVISTQIFLMIISAVILFCTCCYAKMVWPRIPFATANLVTGLTIVRTNCGVSLAAYIFSFFSFGWGMIWTVALTGVYDQSCGNIDANADPSDETNQCELNQPAMFGLLLSFYFTAEVIKNVVHVTVAGVAGTWWFSPDEANSCCSSAITSSLCRASTTSFGSICFGSLLVAIIQALKQMAHQARQTDSGIAVCIAECILDCLQSIIEYFNKWAFVYVGLYGYGYCEAGKNVMTLFKNKGWDVIIADDLIGGVLVLVSIVVGGLTGGIAVFIESQNDWFDNFEEVATWIAFIIGAVIGLVVCFILMGTVSSSVNSVIVLFAEAPSEFQENHPELSNKMRAAYLAAHPGIL